jgi:hypothetical protein
MVDFVGFYRNKSPKEPLAGGVFLHMAELRVRENETVHMTIQLVDNSFQKELDFGRTGVTGIIVALPFMGKYRVRTTATQICARSAEIFFVDQGDSFADVAYPCGEGASASTSLKVEAIMGSILGAIVVVVAVVVVIVMVRRRRKPTGPKVISYLEQLRQEKGAVSYPEPAKGKKV